MLWVSFEPVAVQRLSPQAVTPGINETSIHFPLTLRKKSWKKWWKDVKDGGTV